MRVYRNTLLRALLITIAALALSVIGSRSLERKARAASTGSSALLTVQGSGAVTTDGDYVSDATGLDTSYHYFIEVPPGLNRLKVDIFDADIGMGGAAEADAGRDRDRNGFNTSATYTLIDPNGSQQNTDFTTGSATLPLNSDNAWLTFYDSTGATVRDNFSSTSYSNNDGLMSWGNNWTEINDDGSATTGLIQVTGGELRIEDNGDANPSGIHREANILHFATATLSFDFHTANVEANDSVLVQVSSNGGSSWTTLETLTGPFGASSRSYDISSFEAVNTGVRFITSGASFSGDDQFFVDNVQIKDSAIAAGHWELRVDQSSAVTAGDDINAFGIRANDGDTTSGGTELNMYADSFYPIGVNPPASGVNSRSYTFFPYITSGCTCSKNDFDYDSDSGNVGSIALTSRTSAFTQNFSSSSLSSNNAWRRDSITGWTSDSTSDDYGIWTADTAITSYVVGGTPNGNFATLYFSNFQASTNPPTANPQNNSFRLYLPTDGGVAPVKPYLLQTFIGPGTVIPVGQTATILVWVEIKNPTPNAITFSSTNLITANVPGAGAVYAGSPSISQGTIATQPAVGGTGDIDWNPGTLAAGNLAVLIYHVKVTPTSTGQRILVTGSSASGNGTRAEFVDETGNTTQTRATFHFGPVCELAATQGLLYPVSYPPGLCNMPSLPGGRVGVPYDQTIGTSTILVFGSLPPGLSISGGHLSGTPTMTGNFSFSLASGNAALICMSSRAYTLNIAAPSANDGLISGQILDGNGKPVGGVGVRLSGSQNRLAITDANGNYHFDQVETNGFYTVAPSRANFLFSPTQRSFSLLGEHVQASFEAFSTAGSENPLDTTEYFVRQQYLDFLNREPDEAGLNYWYDNIQNCGADLNCLDSQRVATSAAFFLSIEFQRTGYFVYRTAQAAFGSLPNAPAPIKLNDFQADTARIGKGVVVNQGDWETTLSNNQQSYLNDYVLRPGFESLYPASMSPADFASRLFENAGVTPTESDRTSVINEFGSAVTTADLAARARALQIVVENPTVIRQQFNPAFVLMQYFGYLRRNPNNSPDIDYSGYNYWLAKLNQFNGDFINAEMVKAFITSDEYRNRFH